MALLRHILVGTGGSGVPDLLNGRLKLTVGFDALFDKGKQDLHLTGRTYVPESEYRDLSLFLHGNTSYSPH